MEFQSRDLNDFAINIVKQQGLNRHQLESFDLFIQNGLSQIMEQLFEVFIETVLNNQFNDGVEKIHTTVKLKNIRPERPLYDPSNPTSAIFPDLCRRNDLTYVLRVLFDVHITLKLFLVGGATNEQNIVLENKEFRLPNMVHSKTCHLYGLTKEQLLTFNEDPTDSGGIFIARGKEWLIRLTESKLFNIPHIYNTKGHEKEATRAEIISKEGDAFEHSSQMIVILSITNTITLRFASYNPFKTLGFPFFIFYRLFGIINDADIINLITSQAPTKSIQDQMNNILFNAILTTEGCFEGIESILDPAEILERVALCIVDPTGKEKITDAKKITLIKIYRDSFMNTINNLLFPHIGKSEEDYINKLVYLSTLLYQVLAVNLNVIPETDRDAWFNKRAITSGIQLSKLFKTLINLTIFQPIKLKLTEELAKNSYKKIQISGNINAILRNAKLENTFVTALTTGTNEVKVTRQVTAANRISSESLRRKNMLYTISAQRNIVAQTVGVNKQYERALKIRYVHPTQYGFICPSQSTDTGDSVGLVKQMTLGTLVSSSQNSKLFQQFLLRNPLITGLNVLNFIKPEVAQQTKVFVNGTLIGITTEPHLLILHCRENRRGFIYDEKTKLFVQTKEPEINAHVSIYWNFMLNHIHFWLDHGRLLKPFLIVRNNYDVDPVGQQFYFKGSTTSNKKNFQQKVVISKSDFDKSLTYLVGNGIIEYLSPDEIDNMLVSYDIYKLKAEQNNFYLQYTHCDIPVLNFGLPSLTAPFASSNQTPRITFQTNQSKQAIGLATMFPEFRCDKHIFFTYRSEVPLTYTIANKLVPPNGQTERVAIMSYGFNQEDSLVVNSTSMNRFMHKTVEYNHVKIALEQNEMFGFAESESALTRQTIGYNYAKLAPGKYYPAKYTTIRPNDVLVAKFMKLSDGTIRNTSFVHTNFEEIVIDDILTGTTSDGYSFVKLRYYTKRPVLVGDKFSSRHGQKGVVSVSYHHSMLPFTSAGIQPDKILSPLAIPARMTNGQLKEGLCGKLCALTAEFMDSTVFEDPNIDEIGDKLEALNKDRWGRELFHDGLTGHWIDSPISCTETFYQRLPKNSAFEIFAVSSESKRSLITKQPLDGKANNGGLRFGEMEKDVALSSGSVYFTMEKLRDDSDGFYLYICGHCNKIMNVNEKLNLYKCNFCFGKKNPLCYKVYSSWITLSMIRHLESSQIGVKLFPSKLPIEL
jgi:DNA-directed RNA polymerase beta subunit